MPCYLRTARGLEIINRLVPDAHITYTYAYLRHGAETELIYNPNFDLSKILVNFEDLLPLERIIYGVD